MASVPESQEKLFSCILFFGDLHPAYVYIFLILYFFYYIVNF